MSNAWGASFGVAWGISWGGDAVAPPAAGTSSEGGARRRKRVIPHPSQFEVPERAAPVAQVTANTPAAAVARARVDAAARVPYDDDEEALLLLMGVVDLGPASMGAVSPHEIEDEEALLALLQ